MYDYEIEGLFDPQPTFLVYVLTSFRGLSAGATHWYCKVWIQWYFDNSKPYEKVTLTRPLLEHEAKQERFTGYPVGYLTESFNTKEDVKAALLKFADMCGVPHENIVKDTCCCTIPGLETTKIQWLKKRALL